MGVGVPGYPARAPCWGSVVQAQAAGRSRIGGGGGLLDVGSDSTRSLPRAERVGRGHDRHPLGWQPSRFLADRAEAERAFALAEQLGSVNAAAQELDTTWPSLAIQRAERVIVLVPAARQPVCKDASPTAYEGALPRVVGEIGWRWRDKPASLTR
jgi:hypothetical protein